MKIANHAEVSPKTLRQYGLGAQILSSLGLSGAGETVLIMDEGNGARQIMEMKIAPIRAVVVGVVDEVEVS